jgi:tetraether lipid synthase
LSFQPVSFTGRDEAVTDERRQAQRYTLSHLAHDVKNQTGLGEPARDWFPISFMSTFSDWADLMHSSDADNNWGQLSCGCHPNCGTGMAVMIDKETKEAVPVTAFLHGDQLAKDIAKVNDGSRGKFLTGLGMALCLMKNYDPFQAPTHFKLMDLLQKFDKNYNVTGRNYGKVGPDRTIEDVMKRRKDRWNFLFIAGMWFQDLFNYDFRRTEQCIIPYATQEGEISFCAYNTGVGWRNIIEKMHMTATLTKWYEEHGRHEIFAGGKNVKMDSTEHSLVLNDEIVTKEEQHDLDKLGIAKNSGEEKRRARDAKLKDPTLSQSARKDGAPARNADDKDGSPRGPQKNDEAYNARMAALYREVVLKEKPVASENGFIPLGALAKPNGNGIPHLAKDAKDGAPAPEVAEPVAGD